MPLPLFKTLLFLFISLVYLSCSRTSNKKAESFENLKNETQKKIDKSNFDINLIYNRSYNVKDLRTDKTLLFDTINFFISLNETQDEYGMMNTIYISGNPTAIDTFGTLHPNSGLLEYWICDFEKKIIDEYDILKNDTLFKQQYTIEPTFHIEKTKMYSPTTGEEIDKLEVRKYLNANPKN